MLDQVGESNVIVRHLVLPNNFENTKKSLETIRSFSPNICLSLMTQYTPLYKALNYSEINCKVNKEEYDKVMQLVEELGFQNGFFQP
jgi:putative pyruvate formate lyase activating enzyme